jgi:hypothetical protein
MIDTTIILAITTALISLGGGGFLYLKNEIKILQKENENLRADNNFLADMLNYATTAIIDIADTRSPTSEALKIAKEIQKKVAQRLENKKLKD